MNAHMKGILMEKQRIVTIVVLIMFLAAVMSGGFWYFQKQKAHNVRTAAIIDALQLANNVQGKVLQYYFDHGTFPSSNSEAGILKPEAYQRKVLKSITVKQGGQIWLHFNKESGVDNGSIIFIPKMDFKSQKLWERRSDSFPDLSTYCPG
jgi:hypothetical protein